MSRFKAQKMPRAFPKEIEFSTQAIAIFSTAVTDSVGNICVAAETPRRRGGSLAALCAAGLVMKSQKMSRGDGDWFDD